MIISFIDWIEWCGTFTSSRSASSPLYIIIHTELMVTPAQSRLNYIARDDSLNSRNVSTFKAVTFAGRLWIKISVLT